MIIKRNKQRGLALLNILVFTGIGLIVTTAFVSWAFISFRLGEVVVAREQAFQVAEAGIEYYRWHLAHAPTDYQDGTGTDGPYVHDFNDKDGTKIGEFSLNIIPPPIGSTLVVVESTGTVLSHPNIERTVRSRMAIPSFAKYSVVANDEMRFGSGTTVYGELHSNDGIRFDGLAYNLITSAQETYNDPDHSGSDEWAVHTHVSPTDPLPPTAMPDRPDVFAAGRQVRVPQVDFAGITSDLAQMKADAQDDGHYFAPSGAYGYHVQFNTNDTFTLSTVTNLMSPPSGCTNINNQDGWGTWSIQGQTEIGTYAMPNNGIIFLEDDVWVDGQIDSARVTVAAGLFPDSPATRKSITVNNDLLYTNYDGQDVIALIAQDNFNVGMYSEDDLRIDAALIAQNGRVGRYYYRPGSWYWWWGWQYRNNCSPYDDRTTLTSYGMIATNQRYGFAYTGGNGYDYRNLNYDANLLYGPPPSFPLTSEFYEILSWEEVE